MSQVKPLLKPLLSNPAANTILAEELRLLARVSGALSEISGQTVGAPDFDAELIDLRDQVAEAKPEDIAALVEQMTRLSALAQRYGKGRDLPIDPSAPYFAHMKLREDEASRDVLIGKRGFIDRARRVQIVDWRNAPVSRIYYRYEEDDDFEETFGDRIAEGTVEARRSVTIQAGQLRRVGCPQGIYISDEQGDWHEAEPMRPPELSGGQGKAARPPMLKRGNKRSRLGEHGERDLRLDKHLPEIAALIDPTQFSLITQPESGFIVLQGGAGTGKTTVALHRVAYLSYQRPKLYRPESILVVVPSLAMARYVDHVLPALDVRGVRAITSGSWFERTRHKLMPRLTKRYHDDTPSNVLRFKKHPLLLELMRNQVAKQVNAAEEQITALLSHMNSSHMNSSHMNSSTSGVDGVSSHHPSRLSAALTRLTERWHSSTHEALVPRLRILRTSLQTLPLSALERQHLDTLVARLVRQARDAVGDWAEILTDRRVLAEGVSLHAPGEFSERDLDEVCRWCTRQTEQLGQADGPPDEDDEHIAVDGQIETAGDSPGALDRADDALLLYLSLLKHGRLRPPGSKKSVHYEHLVIDEAQDLSAIELKVLLETTAPRYSVTLAGDTAQRLVFDNAFSDWDSLLTKLAMPPTNNTTLQLGYRSTSEIMVLARSLLGEQMVIPPQQSFRSGAPVELHRFSDEGEAVATLAEALRSLMLREPLASVALIARHFSQARAYTEALQRADVPALRLVHNQDFSFRPGIEVTDIAQVKGLEFDYVVLLDVTASNYPDNVESRHLLHIGATRAAHQLWLVTAGMPSPVLPATLS